MSARRSSARLGRRGVEWSLAFIGLLLATSAHGQGPTAPGMPGPSPKRSLPLYDGREPPPPTLAEDLLGIPRLVLAPPYFISEYVLREPLSVAIPAAEKADLFTKTYDFFVFGKDHKAGIVPVGLVEFDFKPSVGLYAFWNDAGFKGNDLSLHAEAWPTDWFAGAVTHRVTMDHGQTIRFRVSEIHRPDKLFYGLGPSSLESSESRYTLQSVDGEASYEWRFWRSSRAQATIGARDVQVSDGHYLSDPSLSQEAATGAFPIPPGFGQDYRAAYYKGVLAFDSRVFEARRGSGVRLEVDAEQGTYMTDGPSPGSGWIRYGATAAGYLDLTGHRRVLSLAVTAQLADPIGAEPIPFTELVYLGGDHAMRGYFMGRLVGRSAAAATLSYAWPIAPWLDGDLQLAFGNVFGEHLDGITAGLLRFSTAFGLAIGSFQTKAVMGSQDAPVEILLGLGSETFDHGGQIDSLRILAGVPFSF